MTFDMKGRTFRPAFTMVELVFVIVILGIMAAVAIPRMAATRDDAELVKGKNDIAAIRSSIVTRRSQQMLSGDGAEYPDLNGTDNNRLFSNVLDYPIQNKPGKSGHWERVSNTQYRFRVDNVPVTFNYNKTTGRFDCNSTGSSKKAKTCIYLTN